MTATPQQSALPIESFSPTLINSLEECVYRVALQRSKVVVKRPTTFSCLGNAAHKVTESAWNGAFKGSSGPELREALASAWARAIAEEHAKLRLAYAPTEPPIPRDWPGISVTRAQLLLRLRRLIEDRETAGDRSATWAAAERTIRDDDTGAFGRIDRLERTTSGLRVVDLKSGIRQKDMTPTQRRQLLLYAHLVHSAEGEWPTEVAVETAGGEEQTIPVSSSEVATVLDEAVNLVARFNRLAAGGVDALEAAATPSEQACRYCEARIVCDPFWSTVREDWPGQDVLAGTVVTVTGDTDQISVVLSVASPVERTGEKHEVYGPWPVRPLPGSEVRVVGARPTLTEGRSRLRWDTRVRVTGPAGQPQ